jgi:hypothetical protein
MNRNDKAASARAALVAALAATGWLAMQSSAHAGAFCPSKDGYTVLYARCEVDRKSTRLNSSHNSESRMPSSA